MFSADTWSMGTTYSPECAHSTSCSTHGFGGVDSEYDLDVYVLPSHAQKS